MSTPPPRLLTVCLGNICRSPTAEAALREAAQQAGLDVEVRSAGTGSWHVGASPDPRMRAAAADDGLHLSGTAEQVTAAMIAESDVVFAMDRSNLADLHRMAQQDGVTTPIHLFREFDPDLTGHGSTADVPDPYYGGPDGFAEVVRMCRRTARAVIDRLDELLA
ncbi:MAG: low molecular weight protein-tyrosine-phosphatase [Nitriliruptoraceae bacterium]